MGGVLTCPLFQTEGQRKLGARMHTRANPNVYRHQAVSSRRQILDKGKSGPGCGASSVRCKIIGPEQNILAKNGDLRGICVASSVNLQTHFGLGGIMKDYWIKCVLMDRCVQHQFYSSKVAPISNSSREDYAKSVRLGILADLAHPNQPLLETTIFFNSKL